MGIRAAHVGPGSGIWVMPATGWSSIATGELEVSMLAETAATGVARLGDGGWRAVLSQHHNAVRAAVARCEGTEVDTAGDGFFDSPARALDCARAAREVKRLGIDQHGQGHRRRIGRALRGSRAALAEGYAW